MRFCLPFEPCDFARRLLICSALLGNSRFSEESFVIGLVCSVVSVLACNGSSADSELSASVRPV